MEQLTLRHTRRVYAKVDLDAIASNMKAMKALLPEQTGMLGVVKADAYGHGAVPVARAIEPYVSGFAAATAEEAVQLRKAGLKGLILVLGVPFPEDFEDLIRWEIRPAVFEWEQAKELSRLALLCHKVLPIHLAVDTGMSRIGMKPGEEALELVKRVSCLEGIRIEGIFTHFSRADETDLSCTEEQLKAFEAFDRQLREQGIRIPLRHCSNSAAIVGGLSSNQLELCRAGIALYGLYPSGEVRKDLAALTPALELISCVSCLRDIGPGTAVSYGGTFVADRPMRIATIPVGYGDGYPRSLSGKGAVLIHGQRAPILGRICMDQFMVDVSHIPDVRNFDEAVLLGFKGGEHISAEEIAEVSGGFHYEILCGLNKRIPRVYIREGKAVEIRDYFDEN